MHVSDLRFSQLLHISISELVDSCKEGEAITAATLWFNIDTLVSFFVTCLRNVQVTDCSKRYQKLL